MKLVVTGASGFLGSRTADLLEAAGHDIVRLARPGGRPRAHADESKLLRLDAGDPARAVRENAGTTLNLLEGCKEHDIGLLYPSTVRAAVDPLPDPYAVSKHL